MRLNSRVMSGSFAETIRIMEGNGHASAMGAFAAVSAWRSECHRDNFSEPRRIPHRRRPGV